jgi:hypothetical protein
MRGPFAYLEQDTLAACSWSNLNNSKDRSMFSPTGSGLRRAVLGAVLVLGVPLLAACDNEGPAERAGEAIDNTAKSVAKQTGEAMENVGNAIQEKSREASDAMDDKKPAN